MDAACRRHSTAKAVLHMRSAPSGEVTAHLIQPRSSESGSEDQGKQTLRSIQKGTEARTELLEGLEAFAFQEVRRLLRSPQRLTERV